MPKIAAILRPLTDALRGPQRTKLQWTEECNSAFIKAKEQLTSRTQLFHIDPKVDTSDDHVGAVFQQRAGDSFQPLAFFSRKLSSAQTKYSAFDRELLAAHSAVRHWRHLLEGRRFQLMTDHKPLIAALHRVSQPWSARQQRQLAYLSEFDMKFVHIPGQENVVADALSRPPPKSDMPPLVAAITIPTCSGVDFAAMAAAQPKCSDVQHLASADKLKIAEVMNSLLRYHLEVVKRRFPIQH